MTNQIKLNSSLLFLLAIVPVCLTCISNAMFSYSTVTKRRNPQTRDTRSASKSPLYISLIDPDICRFINLLIPSSLLCHLLVLLFMTHLVCTIMPLYKLLGDMLCNKVCLCFLHNTEYR